MVISIGNGARNSPEFHGLMVLLVVDSSHGWFGERISRHIYNTVVYDSSAICRLVLSCAMVKKHELSISTSVKKREKRREMLLDG